MVWDEVNGVWVFTHTVTPEVFASYLGVSADYEDYDGPRVERAIASSYALLDALLAGCSPLRPVPGAIYEQAALEAAQAIYKRQDTTSGTDPSVVYQGGGAPTRAPRDPLTLVYPLVRRYIGGGFA